MSKTASSPRVSPRELLAHLTKMHSTYNGLDASLTFAQYTSPIVIAILLKIAKYRAANPNIPLGGAKSLLRLADGWGKAALSIGEARVIFRAAGLLPILTWLLALHPKPLQSLLGLLTLRKSINLSNPKTIPTLQALGLLLYYPLEHLSWLSAKGVIPLSNQTRGKASLWSVRFWAVYVFLDIYNLSQTYVSLNKRTAALRHSRPAVSASEAEGFELKEEGSVPAGDAPVDTRAEQVKALKADWDEWKLASITNLGWAPLTAHWGTVGGLWTNPLITAGFGTIAATGKIVRQWRVSA